MNIIPSWRMVDCRVYTVQHHFVNLLKRITYFGVSFNQLDKLKHKFSDSQHSKTPKHYPLQFCHRHRNRNRNMPTHERNSMPYFKKSWRWRHKEIGERKKKAQCLQFADNSLVCAYVRLFTNGYELNELIKMSQTIQYDTYNA